MNNNDLVNELFVDKSSDQLVQSIIKKEDAALPLDDFFSYRTKQGMGELYQRGSLIGSTVDVNKPSFEEFIKKFVKMFEEYTRQTLAKKQFTSEEFQSHFKVLFFFFNGFMNHFKTKQVEFNNKEFLALYHGFFISFFKKYME